MDRPSTVDRRLWRFIDAGKSTVHAFGIEG
jgi:hypothetical protein